MNGRNDEREIEDDGFETLYFSDPKEYTEPCEQCDGEGTVWTHPADPQDAKEVPCPECGPVPDCLRCHDTGYVRDWRGTQVKCEDCWNDLGPEG